MISQDAYYQRSEVSNSDLTELKYLIYPRMQYGDKEAIFRFGSLVDAMVTEPDRVNHIRYMVDEVAYGKEEWDLALEMVRSLKATAKTDAFLQYVLTNADSQRSMMRKGQVFEYGGFRFVLNTRCKWDWYLGSFGGDLKTTHARTQHEFEDAVEFFDWDRSRAWYMDIAGSERDFIYAISKHNLCVFKKFICRGDNTYHSGKEKYLDLAFRWWSLNLS